MHFVYLIEVIKGWLEYYHIFAGFIIVALLMTLGVSHFTPLLDNFPYFFLCSSFDFLLDFGGLPDIYFGSRGSITISLVWGHIFMLGIGWLK